MKLCLIALFSAAVTAQQEVPEGHSMHGTAFNEGPRQAAYLMPGMNPDVHFPVKTSSEEAQQFIDQGIVQLHGFWYFEAERSFRQAAMIDPDCAMAYWGMAMANTNNESRARGFINEAWQRRDHASDKGRRWIDALADFYDADKELKEDEEWKRPTGDADKNRRGEFVAAIEELIGEYPDDVEAKALLVNQLWLDGRSGRRILSKQANQALLDQVFDACPNHPAFHYVVHLWDSKKTAYRAKDAATHIGHAGPGIAHMWHMSGHIWARLDRHADAAFMQEASARTDHAHMRRDWVMPDQIHNYAHNNEWLCRSLQHVGRVEEAMRLACNMIELPRHTKWNKPGGSANSSGYGRKRLIEVVEKFECWDEVRSLTGSMYLDPGDNLTDQSLVAKMLGKAAIGSGDVEGCRKQIRKLETLVTKAKTERADAVDRVECEAIEAGQNEADIQKKIAEAAKTGSRAVRTIQNRIKELEGLIACSEGKFEEGLKALKKARFDKAWLSRLQLEAGETDEAIKTAKSAMRNNAKRAQPLANLVYVLHAAGKTEEAKEKFEELRTISARFDLGFAPFRRLAAAAKEFGHEGDWRVAFETPADVGVRPTLGDLGPFRWTPVDAPDWSLPSAGENVALSSYRGRPVLVVFFLGFGCVHCVEQLQALSPAVEKFREQGIDIVAIGTDTVAQLTEANQNAAPGEGYAFPIVSDSELSVFKQYRCFDDFEKLALHGTFLLDGSGRIRWQDISYEPFMDVDFLLKEAERLLALPVTDDAIDALLGTAADGSGGER